MQQLLRSRVSSGQFNKNCSSFLPHPVDSRKSSRLEKLRLIPVPLKVPLNVCKCLGSRSRSTPRPEKVMPEHPAKCSSRSCKVEGRPEAMAERPVSVTFVQPMKSRYSLCSPWQNRDLSERSSWCCALPSFYYDNLCGLAAFLPSWKDGDHWINSEYVARYFVLFGLAASPLSTTTTTTTPPQEQEQEQEPEQQQQQQEEEEEEAQPIKHRRRRRRRWSWNLVQLSNGKMWPNNKIVVKMFIILPNSSWW